MIEIRIIEQPGQWLAQVIQRAAIPTTRPVRTLQRPFVMPTEAWEWALRTMNTLGKEKPDDEGGNRGSV